MRSLMPPRDPKTLNRSRRYTVPEGILLPDTRLLNYFIADVVFVSIDFEGDDNFYDEPGIVYPISLGLSILDTRDLNTARSDIHRTENLCFMSPRQFKETDRHFLFGASEQLPFVTTKDVLRSKIEGFLSLRDPKDKNQFRKVVLVTFDARGEACVMEHLGIRFQDFPSLVGILDVQRIMRILGMPTGKGWDGLWGFMESLEACKVSYGNLHVGGNDAYFNLQLLLSLTSIQCEMQSSSLTETEGHKLSVIQSFSATSLQFDRNITPARFEYKGEIRWRRDQFRRTAVRHIENNQPEVQEARRKKLQAEMERRVALKAKLKENNEYWHDKFEGIEGFSECFNGFSSE